MNPDRPLGVQILDNNQHSSGARLVFYCQVQNMAQSTLKIRLLVAAWSLLVLSTLGCAAKAVSREKTANMSRPQAAGDAHPFEAANAPVSSGAQDMMLMRPVSLGDTATASSEAKREPSEQDPLGLIPLSWPVDIKIHPEAKVAQTGPNGVNGSYIIALVPSDKATREGVQSFYLELLSSWQTLRVQEITDETGSPTLIILADRPGASIEISTGIGTPDIIRALGNSEYWSREVGENPILVRLFYSPS